MGIIKKIGYGFENSAFWSAGLIVAIFIFTFSTFFIAPSVLGVPVNTNQYIVRTYKQIAINEKTIAVVQSDIASESAKEEAVSFSESLSNALDKTIDYLIIWINN